MDDCLGRVARLEPAHDPLGLDIEDDCDFTDPDGHWASVCEIEADGALLVRPDQHVAWRTVAAPETPAAALESALQATLSAPS